ncbi:MAG: J domain-containing protein [Chloroflexi bacterium]|nr:J domain-containing protein [Chloroflexota bacterium]
MASNSRFPDHYEALGLPDNATFRTIEAAYWQLARRLQGQALNRLNEAYEVLSSERRRQEYDARRQARKSTPPAPAPTRTRPRLFAHFGAS